MTFRRLQSSLVHLFHEKCPRSVAIFPRVQNEPVNRNYAYLFANGLKPTNDTGSDLTQVLCEFKQVGRLRRAITSSSPCGGSDNNLGWQLCYDNRQEDTSHASAGTRIGTRKLLARR